VETSDLQIGLPSVHYQQARCLRSRTVREEIGVGPSINRPILHRCIEDLPYVMNKALPPVLLPREPDTTLMFPCGVGGRLRSSERQGQMRIIIVAVQKNLGEEPCDEEYTPQPGC
jgi:hypothetical protein